MGYPTFFIKGVFYPTFFLWLWSVVWFLSQQNKDAQGISLCSSETESKNERLFWQKLPSREKGFLPHTKNFLTFDLIEENVRNLWE